MVIYLQCLSLPYTPKYNEYYLASLKGNPHVQVVDIGKSREGRPLSLVKICAAPGSAPPTTRPCVLIYAREHTDEQDGSWVAQGALDFLASNAPEAEAVRQQSDFLIIPLLDPDGAVRAVHENIISSFIQGQQTPESISYATWFEQWIESGQRIDVVIPLHNPPPASAFHVACPMMEPAASRFPLCQGLHAKIMESLQAAGFSVRITPWTRGDLSDRFSGWLSGSFGTLVLPYEVNGSTPKRQLNLRELRQVGEAIVRGTRNFLSSTPAKKLLGEVDQVRAQRIQAAKLITAEYRWKDPIRLENAYSQVRRNSATTIPAE